MQTPRRLGFLCIATLAFSGSFAVSTRVSADPPLAVQGESGRSLALGSGMRASSISTAALANNPSSMPYGRLYHMEANADYSPNTDTLMLGAAIVDSLTSSLAA